MFVPLRCLCEAVCLPFVCGYSKSTVNLTESLIEIVSFVQ